MLIAEIGFLKVIESIEEATVRVGLTGRFVAFFGDIPMPVQPGGRPFNGAREFGVVPGAMAVVDFEWGDEKPYAIGLKGGPGSLAIDGACADLPEGTDRALCMSWATGFVGGFYMRAQNAKGVAFEATVGPTMSIALGYAFGRKD
jgi:hypothetical protein